MADVYFGQLKYLSDELDPAKDEYEKLKTTQSRNGTLEIPSFDRMQLSTKLQ